MQSAIQELSINEIVMSILALLIVGASVIMTSQNLEVPAQMWGFVGFVFAYYFRQGSDVQANRVFEKMNGKGGVQSKLLQAQATTGVTS